MNSSIKAHAAVLAANLIFASNFSIVKLVTPQFIQPFGLNVIRAVVTVFLFWILYLLKPSKASIQKKHIGRFLICAATGVALNQMCFIKGLAYTTPIHGALLMLATPIFITFIAAWILKEKISFAKILGLVLGISGAVFLVSLKETTGGGSHIILGDFLILINAISYAFYFVLVKPLMEAYSAVHVIRWIFTIGAIMILPFGTREFLEVDWSLISVNTWVSITFIVVGATFLAYLFNIYGLQYLGASVTGTYIYTQPAFATFIAILFFGEHFSIEKGIAGALILAGVYIVNFKRKVTIEE